MVLGMSRAKPNDHVQAKAAMSTKMFLMVPLVSVRLTMFVHSGSVGFHRVIHRRVLKIFARTRVDTMERSKIQVYMPKNALDMAGYALDMPGHAWTCLGMSGNAPDMPKANQIVKILAKSKRIVQTVCKKRGHIAIMFTYCLHNSF